MMLISSISFACDCECNDCWFSNNSQSGFVALVKVIEHSDFLEYKIDGYDKKMPFSMTVEVIKKYKGVESKKLIKIWGDNGILCRPYIANFEVGTYYLIAPSQINVDSDQGKKGDYDFFVCSVDYLAVDYQNGIAYGEYSKEKNKIFLKEFESTIN